MSGPHGILVVDKPSGPTSHDLVQAARRLFGTRQVGHAGTLDPLATGVLVLLLGEATKLSGVATAEDKSYRAELRFGRATDSHDAAGQTTGEAAVRAADIPDAELRRALDAERQRRWQVPPNVSAVKLQGQRAYDLARRGQLPELEPRPVSVRSIEIVAQDEHALGLELRVSKGYYVRALARDLGLGLGVPAHLGALRRLSSGSFSLADAQPWPPPDPGAALLSLARALPRLLPTLRLNDTGVRRARFGLPLSANDFIDSVTQTPHGAAEGSATTLCAWVDAAGAPIALGQRDADVYRVRRGFSAELSEPTDIPSDLDSNRQP